MIDEIDCLLVEVVIHNKTGQQEMEVPFAHIYVSHVCYNNALGFDGIAFQNHILSISSRVELNFAQILVGF